MNDPQEKNTQNPYHIYYNNYLDTNACTECTGSDQPWNRQP